MEKYLPILRNSPFFKGLTDNEILSILHCVNATVILKKRDSYIFRAGDSTEVMGLVVSGCVLVMQEDLWGHRNILATCHAGDFFERFIKKAVIRIANLGADLRDGERGIGETLAGPFNADMLQIFHDAGAGGLFEKAGEVAFAQKEVVGQLLDGDFFGIIFPEILNAVRDQLMAVFDHRAFR